MFQNSLRFFTKLLLILPMILLFSCASSTQRPIKTATQARVNLPGEGVTIDATYDTKLDGVVPGYKILTVALTNRSVDVIKLDPVHDQWTIEDSRGQKQKAIVSLQIADPDVWNLLPSKVKDLVDYPAGVQMGYTQTFDLFFPSKIDLERFRSISFFSATQKKNYDALSSSSMQRAVPADNVQEPEPFDKFAPQNFPTPKRK